MNEPAASVPDACTLPTAERPLRVAEWDDVFAMVRAVDRPAPTLLVLRLVSGAGRAAAVRDLARRETDCCSFFAFEVEEGPGRLALVVRVPAAHIAVLDGMARRAVSRP
jgi:hypothetical protein